MTGITASARLSPRLGLIFAAGDVGPSLTSLCLSFYWLYFLINVAHLAPPVAGAIHGSGYALSAAANLWAGHILDRYAGAPRTRAAIIALLGCVMAALFGCLWIVPGAEAVRIGWYVALSWLFHLCFSFVYLSYLSLTTMVGASESEQVRLSSYRFGGTMAVSLIVLAIYAAYEEVASAALRLPLLGFAVAVIAAGGALICGFALHGLVRALPVPHVEGSRPWRILGTDALLRASFAINLAVWLIAQTTLVLTAFLAAASRTADGPVLLLLQATTVVAAGLTSVSLRRSSVPAMIAAAAACWCAGALLWLAALPYPAAVLLGLGLGSGTVLSWASVALAVSGLAARGRGRVEARAYAALTVARDLVSALVPLLAGAILGRAAGGAVPLLIGTGLVSAVVVLACRGTLPRSQGR